MASALLGDGFHLIDIFSCVYGGNLVDGRGLGCNIFNIEFFRIDSFQDCCKTFFFLRMSSCIVLKINRMINKAESFSCFARYIASRKTFSLLDSSKSPF